jgi:AmiR/NasT family two-component response regulator
MAPDVESALDGGIVTKPVGHHGVFTSLFFAFNEHERRRYLRDELNCPRAAWRQADSRNGILHLMGTYGFDDDEAYQHLRKESMRKRICVEELSARLVACGQGRHRIKNTEA